MRVRGGGGGKWGGGQEKSTLHRGAVERRRRGSGEGGRGVERRGGAVNRWEGAARLCVCGPKGLCVEVTGDSVV